MIETDEQRRWWFATHPEFSWSHKGGKDRGEGEEKGADDRVRPEDVDAYVDNALKYVHGPVADLLRSVKRNFGTEGESIKPDQRWAYLEQPSSQPEVQSSASEQESEADKPGFWHAVAKGIDNTLEDWARWFGIGTRLPPKGTPERAKIERDRQKGVEAKQAQELGDIKAGGKGSGVWSEQELMEIRRTGNFPTDAEWHHDPTVANRPDLAADPRVVRPVRGGRKGHLRDGHNMNWRNPTK